MRGCTMSTSASSSASAAPLLLPRILDTAYALKNTSVFFFLLHSANPRSRSAVKGRGGRFANALLEEEVIERPQFAEAKVRIDVR